MDPVRPLNPPASEPTAILLDALERVREVRGSDRLFDALAAESPPQVRDALAAAPRHPLRDRLLAWLLERGIAGPAAEGAAGALARHGITDLDAWIEARDRRELALARGWSESQASQAEAVRAANAYALVAALLAILALVGWGLALAGFPALEAPPSLAPSRPEPASTTER